MKKKTSKQPDNLILVSRPINFLYALELCYKYPNRQFIVLVFSNSNKAEVNAIEFLQEDFGRFMPNAEFLNFPLIFGKGTPNLFLFDFYLKVKFARRKFDLVSTSGGVKGRLLYKNLNFSRIIITDEGSMTSLQRFPRMVKQNELWPKPVSSTFKRLYRILQVYDLKTEVDFSIWTMVKELPSIDERITLNEFEYLQHITRGETFVQDEKEVVLLGTHPGEDGMSEEKYLQKLDSVQEEFRDFKVLLKPHKNFDKSYHFMRLNSDYPIEYFFLHRKKIPKYMLSFNSTANLVLERLFPQMIIRNISTD